MNDERKTKKQLIAELRSLRETRRDADETRKYFERRYLDLFQEAPVMYVTTRNTGGLPIVDDCNKLFFLTLGYELDEVVGRSLGDFYTSDSRADLLGGGGYESALRGTFVARERRLITKSGRVVETLLRAVPAYDQDGNTVGTRAMFVDITERKRAEEELSSSEEKFRMLFEESQDVIFFSTLDGRLLDINPAGVELFGYESKRDLLHVNVAEDLYWNPKDRDEIMRQLAQDGRVKDFELNLKRRDGSKIVVLETTTAINDEAGRMVASRGILRDVTTQRELEEQLRRSQRLEAVGRLAGGVAHDFNNLLTAILGFAELGLRRAGLPSAQERILREITKASERAAELTRQLLAFARQQVLQPRVIDLNEVIRNIDGLLRQTIGDGVTLILHLDPELGSVKADPGQIEQILVNLAVNARDAMPEGGELRYRTSNADLSQGRLEDKVTMEAGAYVALEVGDSGHGMDKETRSRVFEPFFTTKDTSQGTGLGLSTVYGIVKQSGGYISVDSEPGRGTTFKIYIPRVYRHAERAAAHQPVETPLGGSECVLVVEDHDVVRNLAEQILSELGYRVLVARDGDEALRICAEHGDTIDLLLTDVELPGINGLILAREITRNHRGTRILAMSGHARDAALVANPLDENVSFLAKPFGPRSLANKVRAVLDTSAG